MKANCLFSALMALFFALAPLVSCTSQTENKITQSEPKGGVLSSTEFDKKIKATKDAQVVDVRTPKEFSGGYLKNAMNLDWNSPSFASHMQQLDKTKPVFLYCLAGGRSAEAATELQKAGFTEVYDLDGGIMAWKKASLPLEGTKTAAAGTGLSEADYAKLLQTDKLVLIDFNAPWCAPCRKMKPMLEELKTSEAARLDVKMINADENKLMAESQKVSILPTLILYKNGKQLWRHEGYIGKEDLLKEINKF